MGRRRRGGPVLSTGGVKGEVQVVEPTAAERAVARRAAESRATVPWLEMTVSAPDGEWTTGALVAACAAALRSHPRANAAYRDGRFELYSRINVGVVVAGEDGSYLIPTVFEADVKAAAEIADELGELESAARAGTLAAPALSGATFTVWDARRHGLAAASIPVVPPQAGALAAGAASLTLTSDHRILYGAPAAAFLQAIAHHLDG